MPIHDWARVEAGTFHMFHTSWVTHLGEALNNGLLPENYYAMTEQHVARLIPDVMTLQVTEPPSRPIAGSVAVADAPPKVSRKLVVSPDVRGAKRTVAIRNTRGHELVAIIEIVSSANKDRERSVTAFVDKMEYALRHNCHLLIIDLYPPGRHDPNGMTGAVWERISNDEFTREQDKPLAVASFVAQLFPEAYIEHLAVGDAIPDMPLFLDPDYYINIPLQSTYETAFRGLPGYWRKVVEESLRG